MMAEFFLETQFGIELSKLWLKFALQKVVWGWNMSNCCWLVEFLGDGKYLAQITCLLFPSSTCNVFVGNNLIGRVLVNAIRTDDGINLWMVSITPAHSCKFIPYWCTAVNIKIIVVLSTLVDKWKQYTFSNPLKSLFFCSRCTPHEQNVPNTGRPIWTIPTNA